VQVICLQNNSNNKCLRRAAVLSALVADAATMQCKCIVAIHRHLTIILQFATLCKYSNTSMRQAAEMSALETEAAEKKH
jgi:hypothetical protein